MFRRSATDVAELPWWEPPEPPPARPEEPTEDAQPAPNPEPRRIEAATVHLLLLRAFIGFGWLRAFGDKVIEGSWWSGESVAEFLSGGSAAPAIAGISWVADTLLLPLAAPIAWVVLVTELAIGLAILTGVRFDLGLGLGLALAAAILALGEVNPAAFYVVIQAVLLASPAGDHYSLDWNGRPPVQRWGLWVAAIALGLGVALLVAAERISISAVDEPALVLGFLGVFVAATATVAWLIDHRSRQSLPFSTTHR